MIEPADVDPVEALFDRAAALPCEEREAFLDAACHGDPALRAELESLLAHDGRASLTDGLLNSPLLREPTNHPTAQFAAVSPGVPAAARERTEAGVSSEPSASDPPRPAVEIPGYTILGRIGGGGMGVVYKARHLRLDRVVALKMIRAGAQASVSELARFRTEAQAEARLQHPNIVQVFEVGEANGQPFLCMEFVEGDTLASLIDGTPWPAVPVARLVEILARAIDAAHRQGIVHRDLKPGNILLSEPGALPTGAGQPVRNAPGSYGFTPKITDFGLAKMLADDQGQTETGAFLGSPSYAAPEQAGAHKNAIGPHTDIYSLGAVLYELLTGRPPFKGATMLNTIRQVLDQAPVSPRLLNPSVPPDLEAICLKCLEKNPARRYRSAADLAEDLRRWQHHEPTQARPPGAVGRAGRWCRRHPALTTIAAVIVLGVLGMGWQWREAVAASRLAEEQRESAEQAGELAEKRRQEAEEEAAAAREMASFLGGILEDADPFVLTPRAFGDQPKTNPTALDIVNRGARRLADPRMLREKPLVRANLLDKVGHVYLTLGEGAKATPFITEALELRKKHLPADHADLASSLHNVGFLQLAKGNCRASRDLFAAALDMRTRLFGAKSPEAMTSRFHLAIAKVDLGDPSAEPMLLEVLAFQRARLKEAEARKSETVSPLALEFSVTLIVLCYAYSAHEQGLKALPYLVEALEASQKVSNKEFAALEGHIIGFKRCQVFGQVDQADRELRQALDIIEKILGKHHFLYPVMQRQLAILYFESNRFEDAEKAYLDLIASCRKLVGDDAVMLAYEYYNTARSIQRGSLIKAKQANDLARRRELAAREEQYARAAYQQAKRYGTDAHSLGIYAVFLAHALLHDRQEPDNAGAEEVAREAIRIRTNLHGVGHELTSHPRSYLLLALARQNKVEEIEKTILDLLARTSHPKWDGHGADALPEAARKLALAGKTHTAVLVLEQAVRSGHYRLDNARADPAFASLRESEDYRQLVKKLSK
jgi:tetratricopeptide (TPR) repeat protein